nr:helix-turn-helix domain-containing protein [uncultured Pseudodesulfovibrio sp.]
MNRKEKTQEQIFEERLQRIKDVLGVRTQVQLAEAIGCRQSSISDAKRRCSIPDGWLITLWRLTGYSPDWILDGDECGHRFAITTDEHHEPVNGCSLRDEIEADVRAEMDNLHMEDLVARMQAINPDIEIRIPAKRPVEQGGMAAHQ